MPDTNISKATVSNMTDNVSDYSVAAMNTEGATGAKETEYMITKWPNWFGYYKKIPELKKAIDALATWTVGKGFTAGPEETVILEHITGWGEDTFNSVAWNLFVTKKIAGDSFAEIIRDEKSGELINLKPLDPGSIKIIADDKGIIKRYEQVNKTKLKSNTIQIFKPKEILHLCNDRIANEIHGTSVIEACEAVILARNQAMDDWKVVLHRNVNPLKLIYVDTDDQTKIDALQVKYEKMINLKEVMFVPKDTVKVEIPPTQLQDSLSTIKYFEDFFYQTVGIPKVILGGSSEFTESSSKISYLTFEQIYTREQQEFIADLWNQLGMRIQLNSPVSLKNEMLSSESKNTGQVGFQPTEIMPGRNE